MSETQVIQLQIPSNSEQVEQLLRLLLEQHRQTNELLSRLADKGEPKPMLTHKEAAAFLGIHVSNLQLRMERGEIPVYRVGTKKLYRRIDLESWMERNLAGNNRNKTGGGRGV